MKFKLLIAFTIVTILLRFLAFPYPELTEKYYTKGIFLTIRQTLDTCYNWINIPFWYVFWLAVISSTLAWVIGFIRNKSDWPTKRMVLLKFVVTYICLIVIVFNWFWGFNYARIPLDEKLEFDLTELDSATIRVELDSAIAALIISKMELDAHPRPDFKKELENKTRSYLSGTLKDLGYPATGRPRVFAIQPNGLLLRLGVLGVYWPFIGQGQVDNGVPEMLKPFIFVHEMSHAYGFTDEGTCNFLAYIACRDSGDPVFKYSADIAYFRTVAGNYKYLDSTAYIIKRGTIPSNVRQDLDSINVLMKKYPTWVSTTAVYDWYLKAEGIEEGIENYDKIIALVRVWREKNQLLQLKK